MKAFLVSLFGFSPDVLKSEHLRQACLLSRKMRNVMAVVAVGSFLSSLILLLAYRFIPFQMAVMLLAGLMSIFVVASMLASRFGRLCDAESSLKYKNNLLRLCSLSADCQRYYDEVKNSGRPFTRVDLEYLGEIYRRKPGTRLQRGR